MKSEPMAEADWPKQSEESIPAFAPAESNESPGGFFAPLRMTILFC
jgi:hypothetical protein